MWLPDGTPQLGVVLCPGRLGEAEALSWLAEPLVDAGAAVAPVSYPEGRYLVSDAEEVAARRNALAEQLPAGTRLVVMGHSRGGTVALLSAAWQTGWDAVVALSAASDQRRLVAGLRAFAPSRYELMIAMRGCTPEEDPGYYRATSPLAHAAELRIPTLLVHGTLDLVIPHDHSLWLRDALEQAGHPDVELELLEATGHFFERMYGGYVFDEVVRRVLDWLCRRSLLRVDRRDMLGADMLEAR